MRWTPVRAGALGCVVAVALLGCGQGTAAPGAGATAQGRPSAPVEAGGADRNLVPDGYDGRYRGVGLVLEAPGAGPQLCLGGALESYPPRCSGPVVVGWSWEEVPEGSYESASDVRWGSYAVIGRYDGQQLSMTEPAAVPGPHDLPGWTEPDFASPCPTPQDGWVPPDPDRATDKAFQQALALAEAADGYGGAWIDQQGSASNDPTRFVLNVTTTGDVSVLEDRLREVWGGSLCVSAAPRTTAQLDRIQAEVSSAEGFLGSGRDDVRGVVHLDVLLATRAQQAELDQSYGAGAVVLRGALEPLD
jgi:hypothetical protein